MAKYKFNIPVTLHEDDIEDLTYKLGREGVSIAEVVEGFLNDLVYGKARRGSDECERANAYLERCCYGLGLESSFLTWLLDEGEAEYFGDVYSRSVYYSKADPATLDDFDIEDMKDTKDTLDSLYNEYVAMVELRNAKRTYKEKPEDRETAFTNANKWISERLDIFEEGERVEE